MPVNPNDYLPLARTAANIGMRQGAPSQGFGGPQAGGGIGWGQFAPQAGMLGQMGQQGVSSDMQTAVQNAANLFNKRMALQHMGFQQGEAGANDALDRQLSLMSLRQRESDTALAHRVAQQYSAYRTAGGILGSSANLAGQAWQGYKGSNPAPSKDPYGVPGQGAYTPPPASKSASGTPGVR